ncbi:MAG: hypothetical protein GC182_10655 [Rhodopseudomonas sp.]|nr:hypothetical protein [Rhodopseudomonas sp.]
MSWRALGCAAFLVVGAIVPASAQQLVAMRVAGTVESVDGLVLTVKSDKLGVIKLAVTGDVAVFGVAKGTLADLKPGAYIGVGAMPQADGSQRAIQVTVFAPVQRGIGDGFRPWDRPNSTMTNGAVAETVGGVDGPMLTVKYQGGEKKIVVPPEAIILAYAVGDKSELKPGAHVAAIRAVKKSDGSFETNRINVGRGGVVPK